MPTLLSQLCLQLALHVTACEQAANAHAAQYPNLPVYEQLRSLERSARVGLEATIGKRAAEGITLFVGPALDWQLKGRIYFSIEGRF